MSAHTSQLGNQMKVACFGQDSSRLYEREDGRKPWRAEIPARPAEKEAAKDLLLKFHESWQLASLQLDTNHLQHVARLQDELRSASAGRKSALQLRLQKAEEAHARLSHFQVCFDERRMLLGCNTFISYVNGLPHGTRVALRAKARVQPYEVGKLKGTHAVLKLAYMSLDLMPCTDD